MSIYHLSIKVGSRSKGKSAVAASAYRSGTKLYDEEIGNTVDFTRKKGIVFSEVSICENAPLEYLDRETLWNAVHKIEKSKDAQLWREIEAALPIELNRDEQISVVRKFVKQFTVNGMCADWSIHDNKDGNPHVHIMLTMRAIKQNGEWAEKEKKRYALDENGNKIPVIDPETGKQKVGARGRKIWKRETVKSNEWNSRANAEEWRESWARYCNELLSAENKIDHRSYKRQGMEYLPTIHEGYAARKRAAKGIDTDRVNINREIMQFNEAVREHEQRTIELDREFKVLEKQLREEQEWSRKRSEELKQQEQELKIAYEESRFMKKDFTSNDELMIYCEKLREKIKQNNHVINKYSSIKTDLNNQLSYIWKYKEYEDIYLDHRYEIKYQREVSQCEYALSMMKKCGIKECDGEYLHTRISKIGEFLTELKEYNDNLRKNLDLYSKSFNDKVNTAAEHIKERSEMTRTERRQERILSDNGELKKLYNVEGMEGIGLQKWAKKENRKIQMQTLIELHKKGFLSTYEFDDYREQLQNTISENTEYYTQLKEKKTDMTEIWEYIETYHDYSEIYDYYKNVTYYPDRYFRRHEREIELFEEAKTKLEKIFDIIPSKAQYSSEISLIDSKMAEIRQQNRELREELYSLDTLDYNLGIIYEKEPVKQAENENTKRSELKQEKAKKEKPKERSFGDDFEL